MSVLLDTNVISELTRPRPEQRVVDFLRQQSDPLLSVVTIHEIAFGAECARDTKRRAALIAWVAAVRNEFSGRVVKIDENIAERAGRLRATARASGAVVAPLDSLIAATASVHGVSIATRNVSDFAALGVPLIDPWAQP